MANNHKFGNRQDRQASEGYQEVSTGMPKDRFQDSKQVLNPDQLGGADSPVAGNASGDTSGSIAKKLKAKISVRPDTSVEVLDGKQVGGVPLEAAAVSRSVAGFSGQSVSDDASKIPYQKGDYRPTSRYGKKRSEDLFELDNTVSEQIVPEVEDALDLREAPDAKMGYNGRKQFKQTRGKKNAGGVPQSLLFEASADLNFHNVTTATCGQMVDKVHNPSNTHEFLNAIDPQADYPSVAVNLTDGSPSYTNIADPMHKGNYLLRNLKIVNDGTKITSISFEEDMIPVVATKVVRDQANHNWQVDANNVTKSMIKMQTELGRETTDKWSPLAYVIKEPYQYNMLMHDIEATTGAIMFDAYRAAVSSLSFQRNIISKDGIGTENAAVRMFAEGTYGSLADGSICDGVGFENGIWNKAMYNAGSAAALIAMFDSLKKYRTKADILGMQRSLALHLSQADNNINPLRMHAKYAKVVDKAHMFSTVEGTYNPLLPIHATREMSIINPLSLNYFLQGWKHPSEVDEIEDQDEREKYDPYTGLYSVYTYEYSDIRNTYMSRVSHPIVAGLVQWLLKHERAWIDTFGSGTCTMPTTFNFTAPSLFEFILCSASQYVALQRNVIFRDVLFAGEQSTYVWDDLTSLKDIDPLHSTQLSIKGYNEDLGLGKLASDTALRIMWADGMQLIAEKINSATTTGQFQVFTLPWYFNEQSFTAGSSAWSATEGYYDEDTAFNMSIPSIRQGVRHEYVDMIKAMAENDVRLALDRILDVPSFLLENTAASASTWVRSYIEPTGDWRTNNVKFASLRYDNNSDGRVIVKYITDGSNMGDGVSYCNINPVSYYAVPKELGYIWPSTFGYTAQQPVSSITYAKDSITVTRAGTYSGNFAGLLDTTAADEMRSYRVKADANTEGAISRSAALSQTYKTAYSAKQFYQQNEDYTAFCGIVLNHSYEDAGYEQLAPIHIPRSKQASTAVTVTATSSMARTLWSLLQRYFRPVNVFEGCYDTPDTTAAGTTTTFIDPLEPCFMFGLCGFLASDYTQATLERLDVFDQLGLDYTEDVNVKESLLFR